MRMKKFPTTSVLGVEFACLTMRQVVRLITREIRKREEQNTSKSEPNFWGKTEKIAKQSAFFIVTPNPEMCLLAQANPEFQKTLNSADLSVPDGTGILWASSYLAKRSNKWLSLIWGFVWPRSIRKVIPERVTGSDLTLSIARQAERNGWRIFLLGAGKGIAERAASSLEKNFPKIKIAGTYAGSPAESEEKHIRAKIIHARTDILLVAYGAPKQEQWLAHNLRFLAGVKCAVGIGGTFDFLAGNKPRAPKWMRSLGLEWAWRLWIEPTRWQRIKNAVIDFPDAVAQSERDANN